MWFVILIDLMMSPCQRLNNRFQENATKSHYMNYKVFQEFPWWTLKHINACGYRGADYAKIPRKLLDVMQDYVASSTTWRLSCHQLPGVVFFFLGGVSGRWKWICCVNLYLNGLMELSYHTFFGLDHVWYQKCMMETEKQSPWKSKAKAFWNPDFGVPC